MYIYSCVQFWLTQNYYNWSGFGIYCSASSLHQLYVNDSLPREWITWCSQNGLWISLQLTLCLVQRHRVRGGAEEGCCGAVFSRCVWPKDPSYVWTAATPTVLRRDYLCEAGDWTVLDVRGGRGNRTHTPGSRLLGLQSLRDERPRASSLIRMVGEPRPLRRFCGDFYHPQKSAAVR